MKISVIAESADWIVVEKPPYLEVHPSKPNGRMTLWDKLRELLAFELVNGGQVSLINRLDRETSGLTLVAKHHAAARDLHLLMQAREVTKEYLALTWGWPETATFSVNQPILRQGDRQPSRIHLKQMVHAEGASAHTHFTLEQRWQRPDGVRFSLIRARPITGRMHQIRVHLASQGLPIVGDKLYGPDENNYLEFIDTGWTAALQKRLLLPRHALHSTTLALPTRGLEWQSPLPEDLSAWIRENFLATPGDATL